MTVQLLKDFKFRRNLIIQGEVVLIGVVATTGSTSLMNVVPYCLIMIVQCLVIGLTGSQRTLSRTSSVLSPVIIAALLVDLPSKYILQYYLHKGKPTYLENLAGLRVDQSLLTYEIQFISKVLLFII